MDYTIPEPRHIEPNKHKKNIILIGGKTNIGKTNISKSLINENVGYLSLDKLLFTDIKTIPEIKETVIKKNLKMGDGYILDRLILHNSKKYVQHLLTIIDNLNYHTIIIDGHLLEHKIMIQTIIDESKCNVWNLTKIKNVNR